MTTPEERKAFADQVMREEGRDIPGEPRIVTLTPTDEGFERMAIMFLDTVLGDVKLARRKAAADLMWAGLDIVRYFTAKAAVEATEGSLEPALAARRHLRVILDHVKEQA